MSSVGTRAQLIRDEATVLHAYQDSMEGKCKECGKSNGYWTIATGYMIDKRKGGAIPQHIADQLLDWSIREKTAEVYGRWPWVIDLDEPRKSTLIQMAFQLGVDGLAEFRKAMEFMRQGSYLAAAQAFADSKVAREQTPARWARHCEQIRTGVWQ